MCAVRERHSANGVPDIIDVCARERKYSKCSSEENVCERCSATFWTQTHTLHRTTSQHTGIQNTSFKETHACAYAFVRINKLPGCSFSVGLPEAPKVYALMLKCLMHPDRCTFMHMRSVGKVTNNLVIIPGAL